MRDPMMKFVCALARSLRIVAVILFCFGTTAFAASESVRKTHLGAMADQKRAATIVADRIRAVPSVEQRLVEAPARERYQLLRQRFDHLNAISPAKRDWIEFDQVRTAYFIVANELDRKRDQLSRDVLADARNLIRGRDRALVQRHFPDVFAQDHLVPVIGQVSVFVPTSSGYVTLGFERSRG